MTSARHALLAVMVLSAACGSPAAPSVFTSLTGTWAGRFEQLSCTLPVDGRPCGHNRTGTVSLTLVQHGTEIEGRVEFWSDQGLSSPLIGPLTVTGMFASASLSLTGSDAIPTPAGNIERFLHDWETSIDPGTGRMHGSTAWTIVAPVPPITGASRFSYRVYAIQTLRRVAD